MAELVHVAPEDVRPGDLARFRARRLDIRQVTQVTEQAVWLDLGGESMGPFPKHSYRFARWVDDEG